MKRSNNLCIDVGNCLKLGGPNGNGKSSFMEKTYNFMVASKLVY